LIQVEDGGKKRIAPRTTTLTREYVAEYIYFFFQSLIIKVILWELRQWIQLQLVEEFSFVQKFLALQ
jgi:hypothetical protein